MSETVSASPSSTASVNQPVVASGGTSPVSWDDLEAVSNFKKEVKKQEVKEEKEAEAAVQKPKKETKSEAKADDEETDKEEVRVKGDKKGKESDKKEVAEKVQAPRKLKLKGDDGEVELSADIKVPVKVDGKTVEVPLQEAINRYSQQSHLDKLYKDYKTQSEKFESERKSISEALNKSYDFLVNKKDLRGFLDFMGEALQVDSQALYNDAVANLTKQLEEWQGLSPEERKLKEVEQENAYWRSKHEAKKQEAETAKSREALESEVKQVMERFSMDQAALVKAYDDLKSLGHKEEDITPEFLGRYHSNIEKVSAIESSLREIDEALVTDENVETLAADMLQIGLSKDEIKEAIRQIYGEPPEQKLAKKMAKSERANRTPGPKNPDKDPVFFGDI
jgi:hypothetical protein